MDRFVLKVWISPRPEVASTSFFTPVVFSQEKTEYWYDLKHTVEFLDSLNERLNEKVAHYELFIINPFSYDIINEPFHWYNITQDITNCVSEEEIRLKSGKIRKKQYNHFSCWVDANMEIKERPEFFAFLLHCGIKNVKLLLRRGEKLPKIEETKGK